MLAANKTAKAKNDIPVVISCRTAISAHATLAKTAAVKTKPVSKNRAAVRTIRNKRLAFDDFINESLSQSFLCCEIAVGFKPTIDCAFGNVDSFQE